MTIPSMMLKASSASSMTPLAKGPLGRLTPKAYQAAGRCAAKEGGKKCATMRHGASGGRGRPPWGEEGGWRMMGGGAVLWDLGRVNIVKGGDHCRGERATMGGECHRGRRSPLGGKHCLPLVPTLWRTLERAWLLVRSSPWPFKELWSEQAFEIMYGGGEGQVTMADNGDVEVGMVAIKRRMWGSRQAWWGVLVRKSNSWPCGLSRQGPIKHGYRKDKKNLKINFKIQINC